MKGADPTAPDIEGARRRYPNWSFWREGNAWLARREGGSSRAEGLSLESLEGKIAREERARAAGKPPSAGGPG